MESYRTGDLSKLFAVFLILTAVVLFFHETTGKAETQSVDDVRNLVILPFTFDESPNAELVAGQAAFILRRKLRIGKFAMPEIEQRVHGDIPVVWNNRALLTDYFQQQKIRWIVSGHVENITYNRNGHNPGNRFFGMAGIPVKADVIVRLYDCQRRIDLWEETFQAHITVPRLRVFGLNRSAFPATVKSVDAFVHDVILKAARGVLSTIIRNESGVMQDE